jgi:hypothetical protein
VTGNLFDRLRRLLEARGPVNWGLAREIAESVAGPAEPVDPWVAEEFVELTHTAALRVAAASPLDAAAAGEVRALDRRSWAAASVTGFAYLAEPLAAKMAGVEGGAADPMLASLGPALVGMQMGSMAGFLSHRVLAGFDVGLPVEGAPPTFVVPNITAFTTDHGLDPRQARLWLRQITGADGPFAKQYGNKRIAVKADQDEGDHGPFGKARGAFDQIVIEERFHAREQGLPGSSQLFHVGHAEEIETQPEDPVEDHMDDEPDQYQVDNGLHDTARRLRHILERPIPQKHMLPQTHQNHHRQVHDEGVGEGTHRTAWVTENVPSKPGYQEKNNE